MCRQAVAFAQSAGVGVPHTRTGPGRRPPMAIFFVTVGCHRQLFHIVRGRSSSLDSLSETLHYRTLSPTRRPHQEGA